MTRTFKITRRGKWRKTDPETTELKKARGRKKILISESNVITKDIRFYTSGCKIMRKKKKKKKTRSIVLVVVCTSHKVAVYS